MRIFRVIDQDEKKHLLEDGNIKNPYKSKIYEPNSFLNGKLEDFMPAKYFYFNIEDVLTYAQFLYQIHGHGMWPNYALSVMELELDEKDILKHFCYGIYKFPDGDGTSSVESGYCHAYPEVLLPLEIIHPKIEKKEYKLTNLAEKQLEGFQIPHRENRNEIFVNMGINLYNIINARNTLEGCNEETEDHSRTETERLMEYQEAKSQLQKNEQLFPSIYERFIETQRKYDKQISDFIPETEDSMGTN